jgi:hypothetical protein
MDRIPAETLDGILEYVLEDGGPTVPADCTTPLDSDPLLDNLRALRLVCKTFRDSVADRFWQFYDQYSVLLTRDSLKKLKRVAQNKYTRRQLKLVWIFPYQLKRCLTEWPTFRKAFKEERECPRKNYLNLKNGAGEVAFDGTKILKAFRAYKHLYEQQQQIIALGERKAMLTEIFELLNGHISAINISGGWCGPGFRPLVKKVGISHFHSADMEENNGPDINRAVSDIIHALYWSRIKLCGLNFIHADNNFIDLPDRTLRYLRQSRTDTKCHIHNVNLSLSSEVAREGYSEVHKILQACPNVSHLVLHFPDYSDWPVDIRYLFGSKQLKRLEHLHISGFTTDAEDMAALLYRHRDTLICLEMRDIVLERGSWASVFKFMHDHLKLNEFFIRHVFQPGICMMHAPGDAVENYVLRKTDTVDWPEYHANRLAVTTNRLLAMEMLTAMMGEAAGVQAIFLDPSFWTADTKISSAGPPGLKVVEIDEDAHIDWEIENGFASESDSDYDDDEDENEDGDEDAESDSDEGSLGSDEKGSGLEAEDSGS